MISTGYYTVIYKDIAPGDEARELGSHPKTVGLAWGNLIHENNTFRALIDFLLTNNDPLEFLHCWNEGDFEACRREWPEAPEDVYPTGT